MKKLTTTDDGEVIIQNVSEEELDALIQKGFKEVFWKTPNNHNTDEVVKQTALTCLDPSKTKQEFAREADINVILAKFLNTGELPLTGAPLYQNADAEFDLQDAIVTRAEVDEAWGQLPAAVRNILKDPKTFTDYVQHCLQVGDLEPLRELGLADAVERATPLKPEPATPVAGSEEAAPAASKAAPAA